MYFDHTHPTYPFNSSYAPPTPLYPPTHDFVDFVTKNPQGPICDAHKFNGDRSTYWSMITLPVATSLKKIESPYPKVVVCQ